MISNLRLVKVEGELILQAYSLEVAGLDESGCPHLTGRGIWGNVGVVNYDELSCDQQEVVLDGGVAVSRPCRCTCGPLQ